MIFSSIFLLANTNQGGVSNFFDKSPKCFRFGVFSLHSPPNAIEC